MEKLELKPKQQSARGNIAWWRQPRRLILAGLGALLIICLGLVGWALGRKPVAKSTPTPTTTPFAFDEVTPLTNTPAGLPSFQIVGKIAKQYETRIQVVTTERSKEGLIKLNDTLYTQYRQGVNGAFYIDYFDDVEIAKVYFQRVTSSQYTKEQKLDLFKHYVAVMVDNQQLQLKQLYQQVSPQPIVLKNY